MSTDVRAVTYKGKPLIDLSREEIIEALLKLLDDRDRLKDELVRERSRRDYGDMGEIAGI